MRFWLVFFRPSNFFKTSKTNLSTELKSTLGTSLYPSLSWKYTTLGLHLGQQFYLYSFCFVWRIILFQRRCRRWARRKIMNFQIESLRSTTATSTTTVAKNAMQTLLFKSTMVDSWLPCLILEVCFMTSKITLQHS